jgi:signal transduction histidine kinase
MHDTASADPLARIAAYLEERRSDILRQYEGHLSGPDGGLSGRNSVKDQALRHAANLLTDIRSVLSGAHSSSDPTIIDRTRDIGASRAAFDVHPSQTLPASGALFEVMLSVLCEYVADHPEQASASAAAAMALHHSIMWRIWEASTSYAGFLLNKVHETQVSERRRIARELHDRVGYGLSAANRNLELYEIYSQKDPDRARQKVGVAQQNLRESINSIRQMVADLRLLVRAESLEKALLKYISFAEVKDAHTDLIINGDEAWIPPAILDELFLVIREALRNAFEHARPHNVLVKVDIAPHEVRAYVEDDGIGFDVLTRTSDGAGLAAMRERAALLGGAVHITSRLRHGTHVEVFVPLPGGDDVRE